MDSYQYIYGSLATCHGKEFWFDYMVIAFASKVKPKLGMPTKFSDQELVKTKVPTLLLIGQEEVIYGSIDDDNWFARNRVKTTT